nr:methionine--tRNA ligase [Alphaproteobacteria bacterium]
MAQRFITTPIYYVNDRPHIGHAYTTIICDVIARFWRMQGHDVRFLTGTDEHGEKIAAAAEKAGRSPKAHTDDVSRNFRHLAEACLASNDDFIRTTEPRHAETVAWFWRRLVDEQAIYLGKYVGWYAIRDEAYYTDTEVTTAANGERIAPTGAAVTWREEESYFFNLSHWTEPLLEFYAENPDFVVPRARYNEVIAFVKGGLKDLSVSRLGLDWGIPVPNSVTHRDETGKISGHSVYVWLDALVNYYTARTDATSGEAYWPPSLHVVGKDILRFH